MMKPGAGGEDEDVQVLVERPYSHEAGGPRRPAPTPPPPHNPHQQMIRARPYYRRWSPWMVPGATVACVALFLVTMYVNDCPKHSSSCAAGFLGRFAFQPLKENPLLGPSSATLARMGALDVWKVVHGGQWWRLMTCMWLHAGAVHLLINMLCLVFVGIRLEQEFGFVRVGLVYLVSGLGGSLMSALFLQQSGRVSVGASGALFGLVGSMLSELITNWSLYANKVAALVSLLAVIALNLALGILPHVDNFAHIGGLLSGFLLGFVLLVRPHFAYQQQRRRVAASASASGGVQQQQQQQHRKHKAYQYVLWVAAAALLVVGFAAATVLLFRGYDANRHCSWCHYLSCVPTKHWKCNSSPTFCDIVTDSNNTVTLICEGSARNRTYAAADAPTDRTQDLCTKLCT
ncbi:unnamed protein product [Urochloa decumbens]|uniref:RHOMBOID-like protein n=1 Tax=Urochloa decumbens TaxID=240449 RepID=A0ABC9ALN1_9POAL